MLELRQRFIDCWAKYRVSTDINEIRRLRQQMNQIIGECSFRFDWLFCLPGYRAYVASRIDILWHKYKNRMIEDKTEELIEIELRYLFGWVCKDIKFAIMNGYFLDESSNEYTPRGEIV